MRFLIGDTDNEPRQQLLQDEEIAYFLDMYNQSPLNAAIRCCEAIMSKSTRMVDQTVGQVKMMYSQRSKAFRDLKQDLIKRLSTEDCQVYAGGISKTDKLTNNQNSTLVPPDFSKHMMENRLISPWVTNAYDSWLWFWS